MVKWSEGRWDRPVRFLCFDSDGLFAVVSVVGWRGVMTTVAGIENALGVSTCSAQIHFVQT